MTTIFARDVIKKTFKQGFKNIKLASFDCISNIMAEEILEFDPSLFNSFYWMFLQERNREYGKCS